jgi:TetR/AcrR family transcriptional regulator, copper-responsive repressor
MMKALAERPTARAAIRALLDGAAEAFSKPGKPRGCLPVLAAINSTPANKSVQKHLHGLRAPAYGDPATAAARCR